MIKIEILSDFPYNIQDVVNGFISGLDPKQILKIESSSGGNYINVMILYADLDYIRDNNIKTLLEYNDI